MINENNDAVNVVEIVFAYMINKNEIVENVVEMVFASMINEKKIVKNVAVTDYVDPSSVILRVGNITTVIV